MAKDIIHFGTLDEVPDIFAKAKLVAKEKKSSILKSPVLAIMIADIEDAMRSNVGHREKRLVEIGNNLNQMGGFQLMQDVCDSFYNGKTYYKLMFIWSGIGEWEY